MDIEGYYQSGNGTAAAGGYQPVTPSRIVDTRIGQGLSQNVLPAGTTSTIQVTGHGGVPAGATAVFANFVVVPTANTGGWITPYAADAATAPALSLDFPHVTNPASLGAQVKLSASGAIKVGIHLTDINLVVDIEGYFMSGTSDGGFTPATGRLFDSRSANQTTVPAYTTITVPIGGVSSVPTNANGLSAVAVNVQIVNATATGYAKVWADGTSEPTPDTAISYSGYTRSNLVTADVGTDGAIEVKNSGGGTIDVVVDLEGWYSTSSTTLCPGDSLAINDFQTFQAHDGDSVVSALVTSSRDFDVHADLYVETSAGVRIGTGAIASGDFQSRTRMVYHISADQLTAGVTYQWWIHATVHDACSVEATSAKNSFVAQAAAAPSPGLASTTISGTAVQTSTGALDGSCTSNCFSSNGPLRVGYDSSSRWVSTIKASLSSIPVGSSITGAKLSLTSAG